MNRRDFIIGSAVAAVLAPALSRAHIGARGSVAGASQQTFDYYISPSATPSNDGGTNTGALSHPWSLNALNTQGSTYAGKSVGIIGDQGTYDCLSIYIAANGGSTMGPTSTEATHQAAFAPANGTSGSPTYVGSCNSSGYYSARLATLDGGCTSLSQAVTVNPGQNAMLGGLGTGVSDSPAYVTIDGLVFQNAFSAMVYFGYEATTDSPPYSDGITVQNCHFTGTIYNSSESAYVDNNPTLLTLFACSGAVIQNNLFDAIVDDPQNRTSAFETWSSTGTLFQYNTINFSSSGAVPWFVKNTDNSDVTFRYNYIYAPSPSGADGWDLDGGSSATSYFYNNVVVTGDFAFNTPGEAVTSSSLTENKQIFNNTFVALNGTWPSLAYYQQSAAGTTTSFNNIIARTGAAGEYGDYTAQNGSFVLTDYNLFPSTPSLGLVANVANQSAPTLYTSISTFAAQLPSGCIGKEAHSILGAPTFVGGSPTYPAQYYQLASGSLGKGTGSSNGQTSGTAIDMGAWGGTDVNTGQPIAQIGCNFTS
jgi:hypothetical protein